MAQNRLSYEIFRLDPKSLKKLLEHQINQSERKSFKKRYVKYIKRCKGAKISYEGYPAEFASEAPKTTGLNLNSKNLNLKRKSV
jgi:hypothetical protein